MGFLKKNSRKASSCKKKVLQQLVNEKKYLASYSKGGKNVAIQKKNPASVLYIKPQRSNGWPLIH